MTISFGKKYWLSFCQSYGYFSAIRKLGLEEETVLYQFNDATTGIPHFCYQNQIDNLIKEEPSADDNLIIQKITEATNKSLDETREDEQLDFFGLLTN